MSITFSSGGFDGTMRSDASGNIFIETTGNSKTIRIGGIKEYTGSIERTIDKTTGKVENEVERNIGAGKITYRSGSGNTANQIEFEQTENGAFIHLSGSIPGYNIISTAPAARYRLIRQSFDQFVDANDAWVGQIGTLVENRARIGDHILNQEPYITDAGTVVNSKGEKFCLVHQYERVPGWEDIITKKYNEI